MCTLHGFRLRALSADPCVVLSMEVSADNGFIPPTDGPETKSWAERDRERKRALKEIQEAEKKELQVGSAVCLRM